MSGSIEQTDQPLKVTCARCRHMRKRRETQLFSSQDLQSAGILKAQTEWDQERKQRAQHELARHDSREPFDYEPHNHPWCAKYTKIDLVQQANAGDESALRQLIAEGGASFNPVTGEVTALYLLCVWMNPKGECKDYEPK